MTAGNQTPPGGASDVPVGPERVVDDAAGTTAAARADGGERGDEADPPASAPPASPVRPVVPARVTMTARFGPRARAVPPNSMPPPRGEQGGSPADEQAGRARPSELFDPDRPAGPARPSGPVDGFRTSQLFEPFTPVARASQPRPPFAGPAAHPGPAVPDPTVPWTPAAPPPPHGIEAAGRAGTDGDAMEPTPDDPRSAPPPDGSRSAPASHGPSWVTPDAAGTPPDAVATSGPANAVTSAATGRAPEGDGPTAADPVGGAAPTPPGGAATASGDRTDAGTPGGATPGGRAVMASRGATPGGDTTPGTSGDTASDGATSGEAEPGGTEPGRTASGGARPDEIAPGGTGSGDTTSDGARRDGTGPGGTRSADPGSGGTGSGRVVHATPVADGRDGQDGAPAAATDDGPVTSLATPTSATGGFAPPGGATTTGGHAPTADPPSVPHSGPAAVPPHSPLPPVPARVPMRPGPPGPPPAQAAPAPAGRLRRLPVVLAVVAVLLTGVGYVGYRALTGGPPDGYRSATSPGYELAVPQTWTPPMPGTPAPTVFGVPFGTAAQYGDYGCKDARFPRAVAASALIAVPPDVGLDQAATAFARGSGEALYPGTGPQVAVGTPTERDLSTVTGSRVEATVRTDGSGGCRATDATVQVLVVPRTTAADGSIGAAVLIVAGDLRGGPPQPAPVTRDELVRILDTAALSTR